MTLFLLSRLSRVPLGTKTIYWFEWLKHWTRVTSIQRNTVYIYHTICI